MDENMLKLSDMMKELLDIAKKKKNVVEYKEISDFFQDMELSPEEFEKILEILEKNNIDVLRITDEEEEEPLLLEEDDEVEISFYPSNEQIIPMFSFTNLSLTLQKTEAETEVTAQNQERFEEARTGREAKDVRNLLQNMNDEELVKLMQQNQPKE